MTPPLKSGESPRGNWQHINRVASGAGFNRKETIAAGHSGRERRLRTPVGGSSAGTMNYRGTWLAAPPAPYMIGDVARLGAGTAAGMYLSTVDGNTEVPDTGIGWVQISSSSGTWL